MAIEIKMVKLKELFGECRICGLAGAKSSGKSNNLGALIKDFREKNKTTPIYVFGFNESTMSWFKSNFKKIYEFSSLDQLSDKEGCLFCVDEFQRLKINDKRYKDVLDSFIDFIYHKNNWVIFSSANLREFNSIIGSKIERWGLKSVRVKDLVNGSHLKVAVMSYNGRYKAINDIVISKNKLLVINDEEEKVLTLPYIENIDDKRKLVSIFKKSKKSRKSGQKIPRVLVKKKGVKHGKN